MPNKREGSDRKNEIIVGEVQIVGCQFFCLTGHPLISIYNYTDLKKFTINFHE